MTFTDTHTHIYGEAFDADRDKAIERAIAEGVTRMFLPAVDSKSNEAMFEVANRYPENCFPMIGLHPTSVNENPDYRRELDLVAQQLKTPAVAKYYAIGEVGLDFYWNEEWKDEQCEAFERQIELSIKYDLPLAIHARNAWDDMIEILGRYRKRGARGVMHAFSGGMDEYVRIKEIGGFMFGICGVTTFKNSSLANLLPAISLDEIVLETDAPYLTPMPFRGKRNESSYIPFIATKVAELKGVSVEEVAERTTENSRKLFGV